jgi:hypothetical protein
MNDQELKEKFSEEFFNEFQFDAEFRGLFICMTDGLSPYEVIEHLCRSKKELIKGCKEAIEKAPIKIIQLKDVIKPKP